MSVTLSGITAESTHLSGNIIEIIATTSGIPVGATDYKMLLKVVSTDGELPGGPFIDAKAPDENDQRKFNISGYVDQDIEKSITWPLVGFANPHPEMVFDVWLYPGERYIDAAGANQESYGAALQPVFIVKGRLPEYKLAAFNTAGTNWNTYFCTGKRFFTLMPRTQKVSPYQPVKLWWKTNEVSSEETIVITGTFSDASTQVVNQAFTAYRGVLLEFDLQPTHLGFNIDNGVKRLTKYTVTLTGGETFTFNIDWQPREKYWYLFVDNQVGGIDCIWLSGRAKYTPSGEREIVSKPRANGDGIKIPSLRVSGNSRQRRWTINSGIKPAEMAALDVLLDCPAAWLAIPPDNGSTALAGYSLTPVIIENTQDDFEDDMANGLDNFDVKLTEAL